MPLMVPRLACRWREGKVRAGVEVSVREGGRIGEGDAQGAEAD